MQAAHATAPDISTLVFGQALKLGRSELLAQLERERRRRRLAAQYPDVEWAKWLFRYLPINFRDEFAPHHCEFWEQVAAVPSSGQGQQPPDPILALFARGHGKSTQLEGACCYLGAHKLRRFILYISGTQAQSDEHLRTISQMLRGAEIARDYPALANPKLETPAESRKSQRQLAWNANMLYTESGFAIASLGLDSALARGFKIGDQRPDAVVLDDIDAKTDTQATVQKKITALTQTILPASSGDAFIFGGQNLVHQGSIFKKLADNDPSAEFLLNRNMIGPVPALRDMRIDKDEEGRGIIAGGQPTWPGMDLGKCQAEARRMGLRAFRVECQHEVELDLGLFLADAWNEATHVLPLAGFDPPAGWRIDRSFDWGTARPWCCLWWAESDGSPVMIEGRERSLPRGTLIALAEGYGWDGTPNKGRRQTDRQMAEEILYIQSQYPWAARVKPGPADGQIFTNPDNRGETIADRMASAGVRWTEADKRPTTRIGGAAAIVQRLNNATAARMEYPGLFFASGCKNVIRTFPILPSSDKIDGDIDTDAEDHTWDATRYRVYRKRVKPMQQKRVQWR